MRYDFAPMEGVTGYLFRNTHRRLFPGIHRYWMPFWPPTQDHVITPRVLRDIQPEHNEGTPAVPQLLTKSAPDFLWAAGVLKDMGYREVNLNLGCPSGTVTAKGKGAGFLADLEGLRRFLDEVFSAVEMEVSVKTRLGIRDPAEFGPILELYNQYPLKELVVHVRVRDDQYKRPARPEAFALAVEKSRCKVVYNGDLKTAADCDALSQRFPAAEAAMIGRGLLADPALVMRLQGGPALTAGALGRFSEDLYEGYCRDFGSARNAMLRMKELWRYWALLFESGESLAKKLRKAADPHVFVALTRDALRSLPLRAEPRIDW